MRALLLAYYFPPDGGPGAQRPIAFARHLPAHGVDVTVLTRHPPAARGIYDPADPAPLAALEPGCRIARTPAAAAGPVAVASAMVGTGSALLRAERHDVVLATMSPFELADPALELGERHDVPVVFDLRDPWALDGVQSHRTWWHGRRARARMRRRLRGCAGLVVNTPECVGLFRREAPWLPAERVVAITNGWDAAEFAPPAPLVEPGPKLTLLHAGTFLCGELYAHERPLRRWLGWLRWSAESIAPAGRTPQPLLAALASLRANGSAAGREVRLRCVGMVDAALQRCVAESGVADAVELVPYRPHATLLAELRAADALFLTLHGLSPGARSRIVPGKTYEYLASGRPILAGLPPGDARDFVAASPRAFVADPCDAPGLAFQLERLHAAWRRGEFRGAAMPPWLAACERRALAGRLATFLGDVVAGFRPRLRRGS
ncbi:MAG: glycosyltransferase [Planctomycetes bacterium]|nr:glycosyltransferase [Planctomycetota bacterium]